MRGGLGCNHATPLGNLIGACPHVAPTFLPPESRWLWGNGARRDAIGDDKCNCTDIDHHGEKQILQGLPPFFRVRGEERLHKVSGYRPLLVPGGSLAAPRHAVSICSPGCPQAGSRYRSGPQKHGSLAWGCA